MKHYMFNTTDNNYYIRTRKGKPIFGKPTKAKSFDNPNDAINLAVSLSNETGKNIVMQAGLSVPASV